MSTAVEPRKPSAVETSIERSLADTCRKIRLFDTGAGLLLLGAVVCAYLLAFALFDLNVGGADAGVALTVRWLGYLAFLGVAGALAVQVLRRLMHRVNPYYAARRLEDTVPEAKNSVINWLDLHDEPLPAALRKTLGGKAARDLNEADPERVIDRKPTWILAAVFSALVLSLLVLLAVRPGQFFSLVGRALVPFYHSRLVSETRIALIRPESGDLVVTEKQAVTFVAQIEGRVPEINQPGAPALLYRYQPGDKFVTQALQQDAAGQWTTRLLSDQIGSTGVWYKLVAGDEETPLYQISVRAQPLVLRYEIGYEYRPYLGRPPEEVVFPNQQAALPFVKAHRGTDITLVVRTNRALRQGGVHHVVGKAKTNLPTKIAKDDPNAFRTQWTLDQSGDFFVSFTSTDGETYASKIPFPMDAFPDAAPSVTIIEPRQNVERPANGTLVVNGTAEDDLGLRDVTLRLELIDDGKSVPLQGMPYRPEILATSPLQVDYLDLIKLDSLRDSQDQPVKLRPGAIVKYWLEATDNSDYPNKTGNVGKSLAYEIKVQPPQDDEKQKQQRDQAVKQQQKHKAEQDQKLADDKAKKDEQRNQAAGNSPDNRQADKQRNDLEKDFNDLNKKQPPSSDKGGAKGNQPDRSQSKQEGNGAGGGEKSAKQKDDKSGGGKQAGDSKPPPGGADSKPGETKSDPGMSTNGGGQPQADPMKGASKDAPKDGSGQGRDNGGQAGGTAQSQAKGGGPDSKVPEQSPQSKSGPGMGEEMPSAQSKPGGDAPKGQPDGPSQGVAKAEDAAGPPALSKEKGPETGKQEFDPRLKDGAGSEKTADAAGAGKSEGKPPDAGAKEGPGEARGDNVAHDAKPREPTKEDVGHLQELMKRPDGIGDLAARELSKIERDAADPKVREAATEALDQSDRKTPQPTPEQVDRLTKLLDGKDGMAQLAARELRDIADRSPDPKVRDQAKQALDKKWNDILNQMAKEKRPGPGADNNPKSSQGDDGNADPARKDLSRFGGNLQLEDFLKRATPEYRAKAGITDDDWQLFLAKAADYDALLRKLQKQQAKAKAPDGRAKPGALGTSGPIQVQSTPSADDPFNSGQATVPPDLIDAQRRLREKLRPNP